MTVQNHTMGFVGQPGLPLHLTAKIIFFNRTHQVGKYFRENLYIFHMLYNWHLEDNQNLIWFTKLTLLVTTVEYETDLYCSIKVQFSNFFIICRELRHSIHFSASISFMLTEIQGHVKYHTFVYHMKGKNLTLPLHIVIHHPALWIKEFVCWHHECNCTEWYFKNSPYYHNNSDIHSSFYKKLTVNWNTCKWEHHNLFYYPL